MISGLFLARLLLFRVPMSQSVKGRVLLAKRRILLFLWPVMVQVDKWPKIAEISDLSNVVWSSRQLVWRFISRKNLDIEFVLWCQLKRGGVWRVTVVATCWGFIGNFLLFWASERVSKVAFAAISAYWHLKFLTIC